MLLFRNATHIELWQAAKGPKQFTKSSSKARHSSMCGVSRSPGNSPMESGSSHWAQMDSALLPLFGGRFASRNCCLSPTACFCWVCRNKALKDIKSVLALLETKWTNHPIVSNHLLICMILHAYILSSSLLPPLWLHRRRGLWLGLPLAEQCLEDIGIRTGWVMVRSFKWTKVGLVNSWLFDVTYIYILYIIYYIKLYNKRQRIVLSQIHLLLRVPVIILDLLHMPGNKTSLCEWPNAWACGLLHVQFATSWPCKQQWTWLNTTVARVCKSDFGCNAVRKRLPREQFCEHDERQLPQLRFLGHLDLHRMLHVL